MAEGDKDIDLVVDILATPFSGRTFRKKLYLVSRHRPTPTLASLALFSNKQVLWRRSVMVSARILFLRNMLSFYFVSIKSLENLNF